MLPEASASEQLCTTVPKFERYFRSLVRTNHAAVHRRITASISMSAGERYLQLLEGYPNIVRPLARRHIASYLGITPEALSRIRTRIARQGKT